MPHSKARSSTFRSDSEKRTYTTTIWITAGEELNYPNGFSGLGRRAVCAVYHAWTLAVRLS